MRTTNLPFSFLASFFLGSILSLILIFPPGAQSESPDAAINESRPSEIELRDRLRHRIEAQPMINGKLEVMGEPLISQRTLPDWYIQSGFQTLWVTPNNFRTDEIIAQIRNLFHHGMNPENYHLSNIEVLTAMAADPSQTSTRILVDLELLLTDAFLLMTAHLSAGQLDPATLDPNWHIVRDEVDYHDLLSRIQSGQPVEAVVESVLPKHTRYRNLMKALYQYRNIYFAGGWAEIDAGPTMRLGDNNNRVLQLRHRLYLAGDLRPGEEPSPDSLRTPPLQNTEFDATLRTAVIRFQHRHGLEADGLVGAQTLAVLNTPVETRIRQVLLNMERWRWLRQHLGDRHVVVNIANFSVEVVENGTTVMDMRAIVGRNYRQTPVFSSRMTYMVLSPFWHIPPGISRNDIVPRLRANPAYAAQQNIRIFEGWGADAAEVSAESVDWSAPGVANRYRFRQDPGPNNALGEAKFMFPNPFHVYLHDTPSRDLFSRTVRDFSSGCIRIDRPLDFAEYLLRDQPRWNRPAIQAAIAQRREQTVRLTEPMWVHILYWTAWADTDGTIHFRNDIYGRDTRLMDIITRQLDVSLTSL